MYSISYGQSNYKTKKLLLTDHNADSILDPVSLLRIL